MSKLQTLEGITFAPVMKPETSLKHIDLSADNYPGIVENEEWLVGGYLENRKGMYSSDIYANSRFIHLGIDIWAKAETPVYAVHDGVILGAKNNDNHLDYGPTVIVEHIFGDLRLYTLYGHLSQTSIANLKPGDAVKKGQKLAELGSLEENGGWIPHLHFQISFKKPETIDMPGVCAPDEIMQMSEVYPDPRIILGMLY